MASDKIVLVLLYYFRLIYGGEKLLQRELNKSADRWKKQAKDGDIVSMSLKLAKRSC